MLGIELHFLWLKGMIEHPLIILIQYIELFYGRDSTLFLREMTIGDLIMVGKGGNCHIREATKLLVDGSYLILFSTSSSALIPKWVLPSWPLCSSWPSSPCLPYQGSHTALIESFFILCHYSHNIGSQVKPVKSIPYHHNDLCGVYDIDNHDEK